MTDVLLFHHALGLTSGIGEFAARLEEAGHSVHAPDLFEGRTFDTIQAGLAYIEEVGFEVLMERGVAASEAVPPDVVYAGFSAGVLSAQRLAQTRPGARGALLYYSCVPMSAFGGSWPDDVPVQIHGMDRDPIFMTEGDVDAAREIVATAKKADLYLYPGDQHYFADPTLPGYDPGATDLLIHRSLDLLRAVA
jgi:dienelactone hydrolase